MHRGRLFGMLALLMASALPGHPAGAALARQSQAALPAFPGAEGFGAGASGGRGGRVLAVTTLAASGPGSLQAALDQKGPRTIVFRVSGVIQGVPVLTQPDVTVAGQTSPGGVILRGLLIEGETVCEADGCPLPPVTPRNFIVRHLRLRPAGIGDDGLRLHRAKLGIIDHVSVGNASDEAVQISFSSDITVQRSLFAETVGDHAEFGGMLLNYTDPGRGFPLTRLSLHHNLWNRIVGRLPEFSRENPSASGTAADYELSNNVMYDPSRPVSLSQTARVNAEAGGYASQPLYYRLNAVGNLFYAQPSRFNHGMFTLEGAGRPEEGYLPASTPTRLFLSGNRVNLFPAQRDFGLVYCCNDFAEAAQTGGLPFAQTPPPFAAPARHPFPAITYHPADELLTLLARDVGALPRDPMDRRLMAHVAARTFDPAPQDTNPAGDALRLDFTAPPPAPADTDGDGMPDSWERASGLNPAAAADGNTTTLSLARLGRAGYTNLEVYLHDRAQNVARP
ncbi:hypothetical protein K7W42_17120 [Deinococcus sp. HMF7604]|uniref:hypothetical protein n=1 Tax=Deinococcus betulae TaxID=2873312 RepID=UPI001CCFB665|nr:hypothetical protein [Deinococcus betulae]MBZ9752573.1 hypothetical protein [Deinococcus betulae]